MILWIHERMRKEDKGFTLIELMVVVLIIAILIAIAIPAFLGARKRAQRRQAQSALRNTLTTERTYYTDNQVYTATSADLELIEPNLDYATASDTANEVGVAVTTDRQGVGLSGWSKSKDCYYIFDDNTVGTLYGKEETGDKTVCNPDTDGSLPGQGPW